MKIRSFNNEIQNLTLQFMDSINDIVVKRTTPNAIKSLRVKLVPGDASRTYKFLLQPNPTTVLSPIISIRKTNIQRDSNRVSGLNDFLLDIPDPRILTDDQWRDYVNKMPGNPVDISFEVEAFTQYQHELDQIITNLIAFANPDYFIVIRHPKILPITLSNGSIYHVPIKLQTVWNGSFDLKFPYEAQFDNNPFRYYASTQFTVKGWIFPGDTAWPNLSRGEIKKINFFPEIYNESDSDGMYTLSNFYSVPRGMPFENFRQNIILGLISPENKDELALSGKQFISGAPTGYYSAISAMVSGVNPLDQIPVSADPAYLITEDGDLLLFSLAQILNEYGETANIKNIIQQYEETGVVL